MQVDVLYAGGKRFEALARNHVLSIDQPFDDDGGDRGMTPPELFLSSLGSCAAYYAVEYLNSRGLSSRGLSIRVHASKGGRPIRINNIEVQIDVPFTGLDERIRSGLETAARLCLVHQTLLNAPHVQVRVGCEEAEVVGIA